MKQIEKQLTYLSLTEAILESERNELLALVDNHLDNANPLIQEKILLWFDLLIEDLIERRNALLQVKES